MLAAFCLWFGRGSDRLDIVVSDVLLTRGKVPVSDSYLVVRLTQEDLVRLENISNQRKVIAEAVEQMSRGGAERVLLDFVISGKQVTPGDLALDAAMARFRPGQIAIGAMEGSDMARPPGLYTSSMAIEAAYVPDKDGRFRTVEPAPGSRGGNPALWLATGRLKHQATPLDLRIMPQSVREISLDEALAPEHSRQFAGRKVIISLTRSASRSRVALPFHGLTERGPFLAVAAQSIDHGALRMRSLSEAVGLALAVICLGFGLWLGFRAQSARTVLQVFPALVVSIFLAGFCLISAFGQTAYPLAMTAIAGCSLMSAVSLRLRLPSLVMTFIEGNLSPEEAWLWRSQEVLERPVILLGPGGAIKRANLPAVRAFGLTKVHRAWAGAEISRLCMSALGLGERHRIQTVCGDITWQLEWLHPDIALATFYDVTDQALVLDDLERKLITDSLTGTNNRIGFDRALNEINLSRGEKCAIFFMDLNGFKTINDTHGHAVGDELLKIVAKRFASVTRSQDVLARLGGDEFAILARGDVSTLQAIRTVDKLEASLQGMVRLKGVAINVGVAVGFALSTPADSSIMTVINRADQDMYERKRIQKLSPPAVWNPLDARI